MLKWLGAALIVAACGGCGLGMAANYRREERYLRQLLQLLDWMQCELSCRVSSLPQLFRDGADHTQGNLKTLCSRMAWELEQRVAPDAQLCMAAALEACPRLPEKTRALLCMLGRSLGEFDLTGQLRQLEAVLAEGQRALEEHTLNRDSRIRSCQTLGLCAGAALAILLI